MNFIKRETKIIHSDQVPSDLPQPTHYAQGFEFSVDSDELFSKIQQNNMTFEDFVHQIGERTTNGEDFQQVMQNFFGNDYEKISGTTKTFSTDDPSIIRQEFEKLNSYPADSINSNKDSSFITELKLANLPFTRKTLEQIDYEKEIYPQLKTQIEKFSKSFKMKDRLLSALFFFLVFQCATAFILLGFYISHEDITSNKILGLEVFGIVLTIAFLIINNPLNTLAQDMIMTSILSRMGAFLTPGFVDKNLINQSKLINVTLLKREDEFLQMNNNYYLNVLECNICSGEKNPPSYLIIAIKFKNRSISSHTVINPMFPSPFSLKTPESFNKINLELKEFNKKYKVYSTDNVESRVICSPEFMEKMIKIETNFGSDKISCAFFNKYAIVGFQINKDLFAVNFANKNESEWKGEYNQIVEDLSVIADLVEYLDLLELYK